MDLFVARQPIFDIRRELAGYELLYRTSADAGFADPADPTRMSSDVIVQNFLEAGLDRLTGGVRGWVNFTREMLVKETYRLFEPESIVIEVVEDVPADEAVVAACKKLVDSGYTMALDDYVLGGPQERLLEYASIVKLDLLNRSPPQIHQAAVHLRPYLVTLLAERVETAEVAWTAEKEGFSLFQGYFFSRPETIGHKSSAVEAVRLLPLLNMVQSDFTPLREIERVFRSDPNLSFKLLQIAKSATNGAYGVESIRHAIWLVGRDTLHRWLGLLLASSLASNVGQSPELLRATLVRARFMESMAGRSRADAGALFLIGLFSNMDVLLQLTLEELLRRVNFASDVEGALLREETSGYLPWLQLAEAYEEGEWDRVAELTGKLGVEPGNLPDHYMRALEWASDTLDVVTKQAA